MCPPKQFLKRMECLLGSEFQAFADSYQQERTYAFRINTLKAAVSDFLERSPFHTEPVPWMENGFYYLPQEKPGKHPYFEAGVYYIQEPSAMSVAGFLAPQPGEKILDLCAAPGGKSTHIAAMMDNTGLLISNEIHPSRAKILSQNIERLGVTNTIVTNETPDRLAMRFPCFFDRILVDAPCSGEGMFRKDPKACEEWSPQNVEMCACRQLDILLEAEKMLRPGGRLVYSTCTFSPDENEGTVSRLLQKCPWLSIEPTVRYPKFSCGREEWTTSSAAGIENTVRIWPHKVKGEGHFIAVILKNDNAVPGAYIPQLQTGGCPSLFTDFKSEFLDLQLDGRFHLFGDNLYQIPEKTPELKGLKVIRPGWHLGTLKKNRFEPSQALAAALTEKQALNTMPLKADQKQVYAYLRGEALQTEGTKGWTLVTVDGYSLGWGKQSNGMLKNHYPKGLRWLK